MPVHRFLKFCLCLVALSIFKVQASHKIDWGIEVRSLSCTKEMADVEDVGLWSAQKEAQVQKATQKVLKKFGYKSFEEQDNVFIHRREDPNSPTHLVINLPQIDCFDCLEPENINTFFSTHCVKEGRVQEGHSILNRHHFRRSGFSTYDTVPIVRLLSFFDTQGQLFFYEIRDNAKVAKDSSYQYDHLLSFCYPSESGVKIKGRSGKALRKLLQQESKKKKVSYTVSLIPSNSKSEDGKNSSEEQKSGKSIETLSTSATTSTFAGSKIEQNVEPNNIADHDGVKRVVSPREKKSKFSGEKTIRI